MTLLQYACYAAAFLFLRWYFSDIGTFISLWRQLRSIPGGLHYHLHHPQSILAVIMPHVPKMSIGDFNAKTAPYDKTGTTVIASLPFQTPRAMFWVADPAVLKHIASDRILFPKQTELYEVLAIYGPNLVQTDGADWKRHRDVAKVAFGESNNILVWQETTRIVEDWFSTLDTASGPVLVDVHDIMTRLTLLIISSAGFGRKITFADDANEKPPPGYTLPFRPALQESIHLRNVKLLAPSWAKNIPIPALKKLLNDTELAYSELKRHLADMIQRTRDSMMQGETQETGEADLFKRLIRANEGDDAIRSKLSDDEVFSNSYLFLLAGHETTANTLDFALALLALYPHVQKKLQDEVDAIWPNGLPRDALLSYREDMPRLKYAEAIFRETLRLFPAEVRFTKVAGVDTVLTASRRSAGPGKGPLDEKYDVPVPKGSIIFLDVWATHLMPDYWGADVEEFKPERFFDTDTYRWPRDAYLPFSIGARSCIGQRFATLEAICILSYIARQYDVRLPPAIECLPLAEQRKRLLSWTIGVALTAKDVKLMFSPRR